MANVSSNGTLNDIHSAENTSTEKNSSKSNHQSVPLSETETVRSSTAATDPLTEALQTDGPELQTPTAKTVAAFQTSAEVKLWASNNARSNPTLSSWSATSASVIKEDSFDRERLLIKQQRVTASVGREPDEITEPVHQDEYGQPIVNLKGRSYIQIGVTLLLTAASILLGFEYILDKEAALNSGIDLAQTQWGAQGLVFAITFGAFATLSFWIYTTTTKVHAAVKLVGNVGAILSVIAVILIGITIGGSHSEDGASFNVLMLILPLSAGVLICGAIGIKELAIKLGSMAFSTKDIFNPKLDQLEEIQITAARELRPLLTRDSNAKKLEQRVNAIVSEYVDRVHALWLSVKKYEKTQERARTAARSKALADVEAVLAQSFFEDLEQPE